MKKFIHVFSCGSGDYVIAVSTAKNLRIPYKFATFREAKVLRNDAMSPLFLAVNEAAEEAILNSLFMAKPVKGKDGHCIETLPVEKVMEILKKYGSINLNID